MNTYIRNVIYAKDIMILTGRQKSTCYQLLQKIKKENNKPPHAFVTIDDFCLYTGMKKEEVIRVL